MSDFAFFAAMGLFSAFSASALRYLLCSIMGYNLLNTFCISHSLQPHSGVNQLNTMHMKSGECLERMLAQVSNFP